MITVDPPDVQPSLGDMALIQGVATGRGGYRPAVENGKFMYKSVRFRRKTMSHYGGVQYSFPLWDAVVRCRMVLDIVGLRIVLKYYLI